MRWLAGCMGFVWVHADSFLCCVASPFHSFATTLLGSLLPTCPVQGPHRRRLMLTWMLYRIDAWGPGTLTHTHAATQETNQWLSQKIDRGKPQQWLLGHFCWVLLFCWVLIFVFHNKLPIAIAVTTQSSVRGGRYAWFTRPRDVCAA